MKSTTKMKIFVVVSLLIACAGMVLLGNVSQGFQNWDTAEWSLKKVNPDNLYQQLDFADTDGKLENGADGITVTIDEDKVLKVNGTAQAEKVVVVGTTTLKQNTDYVFGSNLKNGTNKTIYLRLVNNSTNEVMAACYNSSDLISADDLTADTEVRLEIYIAEDATINNLELRPVICTGAASDDLVSFYK